MNIPIRAVSSGTKNLQVEVKRPDWQQFIIY
jgi:hypothetical protein